MHAHCRDDDETSQVADSGQFLNEKTKAHLIVMIKRMAAFIIKQSLCSTEEESSISLGQTPCYSFGFSISELVQILLMGIIPE